MSDGGKGSKRRNENTAQVEANWPTNWNAREALPDVPSDTGEGDAVTEETARGH